MIVQLIYLSALFTRKQSFLCYFVHVNKNDLHVHTMFSHFLNSEVILVIFILKEEFISFFVTLRPEKS